MSSGDGLLLAKPMRFRLGSGMILLECVCVSAASIFATRKTDRQFSASLTWEDSCYFFGRHVSAEDITRGAARPAVPLARRQRCGVGQKQAGHG